MSKKKTTHPFKTEEMRQILDTHYPSGEWALFQEVAARTGGGTCYTDAVAVNLWRSRSYSVQGIEIKVSRSDWMRELKNPRKNDEVMAYCDNFWVFAAPGIVDPQELPPGWGLMEPQPKRGTQYPESWSTDCNAADYFSLKVVHNATKLEAKPVSREFFASICRRAYEGLDRMAQRKILTERQALEKKFQERIQTEVARRNSMNDDLASYAQKIMEETGIDFMTWTRPRAQVLKLAMEIDKMTGYGKSQQLFSELERMAKQLSDQAQQLQQSAEIMRAIIGDGVGKSTSN